MQNQTFQYEINTQKLNRETKDLFPAANTGPTSTRAEKTHRALKYYDYETIISLCFATAFFVLTPYIHFNVVYSLWSKYNRLVDRSKCKCDCWDTTFKANYERGVPGYKHVYFNITSNTLKIWVVSIVAILLLYETIRKMCRLIVRRRLRVSMFVLTVASFYPHYYSWWMFFNYWNDDFHRQWTHQLLFTVTELVSTYFVVHLSDAERATAPWKLMVVLSVAVSHCVTSLTDQFGHNVIGGEGMLHQVLRDVGLMLPDVLHVCVPLWEMKVYARKKYVAVCSVVSNVMFGCSVCFVIVVWTSSRFL